MIPWRGKHCMLPQSRADLRRRRPPGKEANETRSSISIQVPEGLKS